MLFCELQAMRKEKKAAQEKALLLVLIGYRA
jgi:hypothetical protein